MVLFNYSTKELTAKVVYYGPGLCGKTTNLQWIHEKLPIKNKGKMLSLATETDRTLFFDFLPIELGTIRGMKTRIQLYTVPGQVFYNQTRRMVLKGADAVVFVADSQAPTLEANIESFENMRQNLVANEIDPDEIPVVLQFNKRDLPNALPIEILNERLNPHGYPWQEAVAMEGRGVEETLKLVTKHVFKSLSTRYSDLSSPPLRTGPLVRPRQGAASSSSVAPSSSSSAVAQATPAPSASASHGRPASVAPPASETRGAASSPALESLPPLELDFSSEPPPVTRAHSADVPTRPPVLPTPPPPPSPEQEPLSTLVTKRDEADELRRRISSPGIPEDEEELELEELEPEPENDAVRPLPLGSAPPLAGELEETRPQTPPPPMAEDFAAEEPAAPVWSPDATGRSPVHELETSVEVDSGESEVEVPIELELAPGTTRLTLRLKITLQFKG